MRYQPWQLARESNIGLATTDQDRKCPAAGLAENQGNFCSDIVVLQSDMLTPPKTVRTFALALSALSIIVSTFFCQPLFAQRASNQAAIQSEEALTPVEFDHLVYATANIDSLVRTYASAHFEIRYAKPLSPLDQAGRLVDTVLLGKATYIEIRQEPELAAMAPMQHDTAQSPCVAIVFRVANVRALRDRLVRDGKLEADSLFTMPERFHSSGVQAGVPAFALKSQSPTKVIFMESGLRADADSSLRGFDLNRIDWLILTASKACEASLRTTLMLLDGVRRYKEGCCDYWVIGSPDHLIKLRFDPDTSPRELEHLSIDRFGVVFAR